MRRVSGSFTFYLHTLKNFSGSSIWLENNFLEIESFGNQMGFKFSSSEENEKVFYSWIHDSADGLGFLFDFPVYASYSTAFEEVAQYPISVNADTKIDFNFIEHALEYSEIAGNYIDVDKPKEISL